MNLLDDFISYALFNRSVVFFFNSVGTVMEMVEFILMIFLIWILFTFTLEHTRKEQRSNGRQTINGTIYDLNETFFHAPRLTFSSDLRFCIPKIMSSLLHSDNLSDFGSGVGFGILLKGSDSVVDKLKEFLGQA